MEHREAPFKFSDGTGYERMMGRWSRVAGEIFLDFLSPEKGQKWLDVGCGTGAFSGLLLQHANAASVTGIDSSDALLETARFNLASQTTHFIRGEADALPFEAKSFDSAALALVINFLPDPVKALNEIIRVLRPGGSLSSYIWDIQGGGFTMEPLRAALEARGFATGLNGAEITRRDKMEALWKSAGLTEIRSTRLEVPLQFEDFEDFWSSHMGTANTLGNLINAMPDKDKEELKSDLKRKLQPSETGAICYSAAINAVTGKVPV